MQATTRLYERLDLNELRDRMCRREAPYFVDYSEEKELRYFELPRFVKLADAADYTYIICTGSPEHIVDRWQDDYDVWHSQLLLVTPIIGAAEIQVNPHDRSQLWLKYVTVRLDHQSSIPNDPTKGIGKELCRRSVEHIQHTGLTVELSGYSTLGKQRLKHLIEGQLDAAGVEWTRSPREYA